MKKIIGFLYIKKLYLDLIEFNLGQNTVAKTYIFIATLISEQGNLYFLL